MRTRSITPSPLVSGSKAHSNVSHICSLPVDTASETVSCADRTRGISAGSLSCGQLHQLVLLCTVTAGEQGHVC